MSDFDFAAWRARNKELYAEPKPEQPGYQALSPTEIASNPQFLADIREYRRWIGAGDHAGTDDELLDWFLDNRNWRELNTISMARDVSGAYQMDAQMKERVNRLIQAYDKLPLPWEEGGRGWRAAPSIAGAIIADPVNLLPAGKAAQAGTVAGRVAAKTGRSALAAGARAGALSAATAGAAVEAGIAAGQDTLLQARDVELGLQDEFSTARLLGSTALGGALGGVVGGAIGAPTGAIAGARAGREVTEQLAATAERETAAAARAEREQAEVSEGGAALAPRVDPNAPLALPAPRPVGKLVGILESQRADIARQIRAAEIEGNADALAALKVERDQINADLSMARAAAALPNEIAALKEQAAKATDFEKRKAIEAQLLQKENMLADLDSMGEARNVQEYLNPLRDAEIDSAGEVARARATPQDPEGTARTAEDIQLEQAANAQADEMGRPGRADEITIQTGTQQPETPNAVTPGASAETTNVASPPTEQVTEQAAPARKTKPKPAAVVASDERVRDLIEMAIGERDMGDDEILNMAKGLGVTNAKKRRAILEDLRERQQLRDTLGEEATGIPREQFQTMAERIIGQQPNFKSLTVTERSAVLDAMRRAAASLWRSSLNETTASNLLRRLAKSLDESATEQTVSRTAGGQSRIGKDDIAPGVERPEGYAGGRNVTRGLDNMPQLGGIQSFLRSGEFVGRAPQAKYSALDIAKAEALTHEIRYRGQRGNPVEFTADRDYPIGVRTNGSYFRKPNIRANFLRAGEVGYYDPVTDTISARAASPQQRPQATRPQAPADTPVMDLDALTQDQLLAFARAMAADPSNPEAAYRSVIGEPVTPVSETAPTAQIAPAAQTAPAAPEIAKEGVFKAPDGQMYFAAPGGPDGTQIALRNRADPNQVRTVFPSAVPSVTDPVATMLGKADRAQWEVGYLPARKLRAAEKAELFEPLDAQPEAPASRRYEDIKNEPISVDGEPGVKTHADAFSLWQQLHGARFGDATRQPSMGGSFGRMPVAEYEQLLTRIERLEAALKGVELPAQTKEQALDKLGDILSGDSATLAAVMDALRRMAGARAPRIEEDVSNSAGAAIIRVSRTGSSSGQTPNASGIVHELFHWAYFNVLDGDDRMAFMRQVLERGRDGDTIDAARLFDGIARAQSGGPGVSAISPQELFANMAEQWYNSSGKLLQGDELWKRVVNKVVEYIRAFLDPKAIDPSMVPLFEKIMPGDQRWKIRLDAKPSTEQGEVLANMASMATSVGENISGLLDIGDIKAMRAAISAPNGAPRRIAALLTMDLDGRSVGEAAGVMEKTEKTLRDLVAEAAERRTLDSDGRIATLHMELMNQLSDVRDFLVRQYEGIEGRPPVTRGVSVERTVKTTKATSTEFMAMVDRNREVMTDIDRLMTEFAKTGDVDAAKEAAAKAVERLFSFSYLKSAKGVSQKTGYKVATAVQNRAKKLAQDINYLLGAQKGEQPGVYARLDDIEAKFDALDAAVFEALEMLDGINDHLVRRAKKIERTTDEKQASRSAAKQKRKEVLEARKNAAATAAAVASTKKSAPQNTRPKSQNPIKNVLEADGQTLAKRIREIGDLNDREARDIAFELARRIKAQPDKGNVGEFSVQMAAMSDSELAIMFGKSLINGDQAGKSAAAELRRRGRASDLMGEDAQTLARREIRERAGISTHDGIPAKAPYHMRRLLQQVNGRSPDEEVAARAIMYRLTNLVSEDGVLTYDGAARLMGEREPTRWRTEPIESLDADEFKKLRARVRAITTAISAGKGVDAAMTTLARMVTESGVFTPQERLNMRAALDEYAQIVVPNYDQALREFDRANFSETYEQFANLLVRSAKGEDISGLIEDITAGADIPNFEAMIRKGVAIIGYVTNGLIDHTAVRKAYPNLLNFGDFAETYRLDAPKNTFRNRTSISPAEADDYVRELNRRTNEETKRHIKGFVGSAGLGVDDAGNPTLWWHATPQSAAFRDTNTLMMESAMGNYGPGVYVGKDPNFLYDTYGKRPTLAALQGIIERDISSPKLQDRAKVVATNLVESWINIADAHRRAARFPSGIISEVIADLQAAAQEATDELASMGVRFSPGVMPLYIRAEAPFDARGATLYEPGASTELASAAEALTSLTNSDVADAAAMMMRDAATDGTISGHDAYYIMVQAVADNLPGGRTSQEAKAIVTDALREAGFDSIVSDHSRTLSDGQVHTENALVVFESEQIRHAGADTFDDEIGLFAEDYAPHQAPLGQAVLGAMDTSGSFQGDRYLRLGEELAKSSPGLAGTFERMLRRQQPDARDVEELRKFSAPLQLRTNASRARKLGMNWIADFAKPENEPGYFERRAVDLASNLNPVMEAINDLPDTPKGIRRWLQKSRPMVAINPSEAISQPESHTRILKALRRNDPSLLQSRKEVEAFDRARSMFTGYLQRLKDNGVLVGEIEGYVPQIHDARAIERDSEGYAQIIAEYFYRESRNNPYAETPITMEDAIRRAREVAKMIVDDEGVYFPQKANAGKPGGDHISYQRKIRLDAKDANGKLLYADLLARLENRGFLANDLEGTLLKYADQATRNVLHAEKFGTNSFGFNDYMTVVKGGRSEAIRLLSSDKTGEITRYALDENGQTTQLTERVPLMEALDSQTAEYAVDTVLGLLKGEGGAPSKKAAMDFLIGLKPNAGATLGAHNWSRRAEAIVNALADYKGKVNNLASNEMRWAESFYGALQGKPVGSESPFFDAANKTSRWLRNFNAVTLLGFTTLTSIPDLVLPLLRSGDMRSWMSGISKYARDPEYRQAMRNIGVSVENLVNERLSHLYGMDTSARATGFFNAVGLAPWTNVMREVSAAVAMEALKSSARKAAATYNPGANAQSRAFRESMRFLRQFGLEEYALSKSLDDWRVASKDPKVMAAVHKFANETIFSPNPNDIPLWAQTPFGAVMFQLKSFPLMMGRLSRHILGEAKKGNVAPLIYLTTIGPMAGAGALATKDFVQLRGGEDERSAGLRERSLTQIAEEFGWEPALGVSEDEFLGWYVEGLMAAGGLGMVAELLYNVSAQTDNGVWGLQRAMSYTFGPSMGLVQSGWNVAAGAQEALIQSSDSNAKERTAVREVISRVPLAGGVRAVREGVTDAVAGEAADKGGAGGWGSFDGGFKSGF